MNAPVLKGGCFCGAVRYECASPPVGHASFCHCETCRRASGAHVVAWVTVPRAALRFAGSPREFASSPPVRRTFCGECGTSLTYRHADDADTIDIAIATLDDPDAIAPDEHLWMQDAVAWDQPADGLPKFRTSRSAGERLDV